MSINKRIAIAGAGLVGVRHIEAIRQAAGVELAAIVDPLSSAQRVAADNGVVCHASLSDMLAEAVPDGVLLATPTTLHVEQALQCIEADCPVLVEKPIATSVCEAMKLVCRGQERGVPILVGHHRRYNPIVHTAHALINAGEVGDVRSVQGTCWFYKPDDYFDVAPWRKQKGAGPVSVNLVHDIDLMRYLVGDIICVHAAATNSERGYDNEDVAAAVLVFANGAIGTITVSDSVVSPWSWEMTAGENPQYPLTSQRCLMVGGSRGSLSIPDLRVWTHRGERSWWNPVCATSVARTFSDPLVNQIEHFADVIEGVASPLVSGLEGLRTLQVIEAIQLSAVQRCRIDIADIPMSENLAAPV